jgi:hypothetical protein
LNISNQLNSNTSNYTLNVSNQINALTSNYALNISNQLNSNGSNYTLNASNQLNTKINLYQPLLISSCNIGISNLNLNGILTTSNNLGLANPTKGIYGGLGDRIILSNGTSTEYPYSIGINNLTLWYNSPSNSSQVYYIGGVSIAEISSSGLLINGALNATILQQNGVNLNTLINTTLNSSNYQPLLISTCNITLNNFNSSNIYNSNLITTSNLNAYSNVSAVSFTENGVLLSSKYLQMTGGVAGLLTLSNLNSSNIYNSNLITTSNLNAYSNVSAVSFTENGVLLSSKYLPILLIASSGLILV